MEKLNFNTTVCLLGMPFTVMGTAAIQVVVVTVLLECLLTIKVLELGPVNFCCASLI